MNWYLVVKFLHILAVALTIGVFGFLQGASKNWLLASNVLLVIMLILIGAVFVPYNLKVEALLESALMQGSVTPKRAAALNNRRNNISHLFEEILMLAVVALMVLKPF